MKNRIKELRKENKVSQSDVANALHITRQAISQYETGDREPKLETWQKLANFFNVSVPYLQGLEDKKEYYTKNDIFKLIQYGYLYEDKPIEKADKTIVLDVSNTLIKYAVNQFMLVKSVLYYLENKKAGAKPLKKEISKNDEHNLNFWKKNFAFILDNPSIQLILKTQKRKGSQEIKVKRVISDAINLETSRIMTKYVSKRSARNFFEGMTDFIKAKQITNKNDEHNLANAGVFTMLDVLSKLDSIDNSKKK